MKIINAVKFIFPGISENERTARAVVSAFLVQLDPTVEELADIRTAVSEAVTNAIVHGYRQCSGDVELHIKLLENREIYLRIKDHGCGITDVAQAMQPLFTTAPEEERAGKRHHDHHAEKAGSFAMPGEVTAPRAEEHLGLVHLCANRFRNRGIEYDELYSAGCVGLLKAIKAFDCGRGVQFSTYAVPVILGEIKRLFRDGGIVHVSRSLRERAMKLQKLQEEFEQRYGRSPTMTELSERSGESIEACGEALCVTQTPLSLTRNEDDEEDGQFDIPVEAPDRQIGDLLSLRQLMGALPEKDRMLLELRYFRELTQSKTAAILGMTQVQVSRREKKLLTQLRQELLS